jgi:5-methylcytosine-specific restriction endonuclease McrA
MRRAPAASRREEPGGVPGRLRRAVMERDRFRCRAAGCRGTGFLAVHHVVPRERGGGNTLENLITLCAGCHRVLHARR